MTAVNTDVLLRLLTGDDREQAAAASSLIANGPIWIAKTVLLETDWKLRNHYGLEKDAVRDAFTKLLGLENVHVEDESAMAAALELSLHGVGIADAIHLSSRPPGSTFVSFDKAFVRRATKAGVSGISRISTKD